MHNAPGELSRLRIRHIVILASFKSEGLLQDRLLATRSEKRFHLSKPPIHTDCFIQMPFHENVLIVAIVAPFAQALLFVLFFFDLF